MRKHIPQAFRQFMALLLCVAMLLPMIPLQLPAFAAGDSAAVKELKTVLDQVRDLYQGGEMSSTLEYDCGDTLTAGGERSYMTIVTDTQVSDFTSYQAALKDAGYTAQRENTVASTTADNPNRFGSYLSPDGKYRIYTYFLYAYNETRIILDTQEDTVAGFNYIPQEGPAVEPKLVMWGLAMSSIGYDMKKAYSAPDILFESFALNENIASANMNCTRIIANQSNGLCGLHYGGNIVFTIAVAGCRNKVEDGSPIFDGLCYHIPIGSNKLFNS